MECKFCKVTRERGMQNNRVGGKAGVHCIGDKLSVEDREPGR